MTETSTVTEATPVEAVETMNKKELLEHFRRYHTNYYGMNRWTKERLLAQHGSEHQHYAYELLAPDTFTGTDRTPDGRAWVRWTDQHIHVTLSPSEADEETLAAMREGNPLGKVLSAGERKSLQQLVDNDFAGLRAQMQQFARDVLAEREASINEEWAARVKAIETWAAKARKVVEKANEDLRRTSEQAKDAGIQLKGIPGFGPHGISGEVIGLEAALAKVRVEVNQDLSRALLTLERQRLTAQRTVLMSGISAEGLTLLSTIPSAQELMRNAALERAQPKEVTG